MKKKLIRIKKKMFLKVQEMHLYWSSYFNYRKNNTILLFNIYKKAKSIFCHERICEKSNYMLKIIRNCVPKMVERTESCFTK